MLCPHPAAVRAQMGARGGRCTRPRNLPEAGESPAPPQLFSLPRTTRLHPEPRWLGSPEALRGQHVPVLCKWDLPHSGHTSCLEGQWGAASMPTAQTEPHQVRGVPCLGAHSQGLMGVHLPQPLP